MKEATRLALPSPAVTLDEVVRCGGVERRFPWLGCFRRLARDYERLPETLVGWHWLAALTRMLNTIFSILQSV